VEAFDNWERWGDTEEERNMELLAQAESAAKDSRRLKDLLDKRTASAKQLHKKRDVKQEKQQKLVVSVGSWWVLWRQEVVGTIPQRRTRPRYKKHKEEVSFFLLCHRSNWSIPFMEEETV
jgi:hypothetical protein